MTIPCPKCRGRSTHVSYPRHPWMSGKNDEVLVCITCGTRVYGPERVGPLREAEEQRLAAIARREAADRETLQRAIEEEARQRRERAEAEAAAAKKAEAERKHAAWLAAMEAEIYARAKCQWPPCPNDHTTTSKYCSRTCSNKNAHAKEKAKREALKAAADAARAAQS